MADLKPDTIDRYRKISKRVAEFMDQKAPDGRTKKYTSGYVYQIVAMEFSVSVDTVRRAWFLIFDVSQAVVTGSSIYN